MSKKMMILGAGPAGASCAYELSQRGISSVIWEKESQPGGLCGTVEWKSHRFDVGPHRFFTKNQEVDQLWHRVLEKEVVSVNRLTRILYANSFFDYPLKPFSALKGLGPVTSLRAVISYMQARCFTDKSSSESFESWIQSNFGRVLYDIFFKTYTEKVWGIPCSSISPDWATQRIKGMNLFQAVLHSLVPRLNAEGGVKSMIDRFDYPCLGASQPYERLLAIPLGKGSILNCNTRAHAFIHDGSRIQKAVGIGTGGRVEEEEVEHVFSSIPLPELALKMNPPPDEDVMEAAHALYYRNHITVNLIINVPQVFPDNWIYVHAPNVRTARIASYGTFSPKMTTPNTSAVSVEYFAYAHDDLWQMEDASLIELATMELAKLKLCQKADVADGFVVRSRYAYPVYYLSYKRPLAKLKQYLSQFENLTVMGRGGMYKYNNQDHSVLSGLVAAKKFCGEDVDVWEVNTEDEYLEEKQLPLPAHAADR
jgi:protoporphyrinogen oxidase